MAMDKFGVNPTIEHKGLRDEESRLMTKVATAMGSGDFDEVAKIEVQLHEVRNRLTELDLGKDRLQELTEGSAKNPGESG